MPSAPTATSVPFSVTVGRRAPSVAVPVTSTLGDCENDAPSAGAVMETVGATNPSSAVAATSAASARVSVGHERLPHRRLAAGRDRHVHRDDELVGLKNSIGPEAGVSTTIAPCGHGRSPSPAWWFARAKIVNGAPGGAGRWRPLAGIS